MNTVVIFPEAAIAKRLNATGKSHGPHVQHAETGGWESCAVIDPLPCRLRAILVFMPFFA
jgi:hypothetical protein